MSWICWLGLLQAGACPPCLPAGGGASLTQEWRGSPAAWAEQMMKRRGIGPAALRGVVPLGPWEMPETTYHVRRSQQMQYYSCWGGGASATVIEVFQDVSCTWFLDSTAWIYFFDPEFLRVIREAAAIHRSDLPGELRGHELAKLIQPGMAWDQVQVLLGAREASAALLIPGPASSSRTRLLCPRLCLSVVFQCDAAEEVQSGEAGMALWDAPRGGPEPEPVFNFVYGWSK